VSAAKLIVSVVVVGMLFLVVLIVIQCVKVSQYVMSDVKGIL